MIKDLKVCSLPLILAPLAEHEREPGGAEGEYRATFYSAPVEEEYIVKDEDAILTEQNAAQFESTMLALLKLALLAFKEADRKFVFDKEGAASMALEASRESPTPSRQAMKMKIEGD